MHEQTREETNAKHAFAGMQGVWRSRGYGELLEIGPSGYTLYEETGVCCLPVYSGSLEDLAEHYVDVILSPRGQAFTARRSVDVTRLSFRRLKALPKTARPPTEEERADPEYNFEVLWHTFNEHYALFELRGVDWQSAYDAYRPQVDSGTTPNQLFAIFRELLRPLGDGHVQLHTTCGHFDAGGTSPLHDRLAEELDRANDSRDVPSYLAELRESRRDTIREEYLVSQSRRSGNRLLEWGRIGNTAGYIAVRAMAGLSGTVGWPLGDLHAADVAMHEALAELGDLPTLAIDLVGNGGGYDAVALCLAGHLIDRKRLAFYKSARHRETYTGEQRVYVEPQSDRRYGGQLALLTSGLTASAAEVFVLALLQHPKLTLIGEPTRGILSDAMERHLPNGWFMTLSNEVYRASDGDIYEYHGIPPHVEIPFLDRRGRESGRDSMLEHVLTMSDR